MVDTLSPCIHLVSVWKGLWATWSSWSCPCWLKGIETDELIGPFHNKWFYDSMMNFQWFLKIPFGICLLQITDSIFEANDVFSYYVFPSFSFADLELTILTWEQRKGAFCLGLLEFQDIQRRVQGAWNWVIFFSNHVEMLWRYPCHFWILFQ